MATHRACSGCLDGCTRESAVHCTSCVNEPWPCDATVLRAALDKAAGRLGYLSTVLSHSNKPSNAKGALEWSEEARAVVEG